jgi:hypothetical protein
MTKELEQALEAVRALPADMQDELAGMIRLFVGDDEPPIELTPEEEASFDVSHAQAARGEFATDDQVRAIWAKFGL